MAKKETKADPDSEIVEPGAGLTEGDDAWAESADSRETLEPPMPDESHYRHPGGGFITVTSEPDPRPPFSPECDQIILALFKFHEICAGLVEKDGTNPYYDSDYTTRAAQKKATDAALQKAKLFAITNTRVMDYPTVRQFDRDKNTWYETICCRVRVSTFVVHKDSGQWAWNAVDMDGKDSGPHAMGSMITYGGRYNMGCLLDLASEETDDDGNAGQGKAPRKRSRRRTAGDAAAKDTEKKKPKANPAVAKAAKILWDDVFTRCEGDEKAAKKLFKQITSFEGDRGRFKGYDDWESITSEHMVISSKERLEEHPVYGADALEAAGREAEE
jgi:hypothetical protein